MMKNDNDHTDNEVDVVEDNDHVNRVELVYPIPISNPPL